MRTAVTSLIRRIEIRDIALELGGAGVNHLINGENSLSPADLKYLLLGYPPKSGDSGIGETHLLSFKKRIAVIFVRAQDIFRFDDICNLIEEEPVDAGLQSDIFYAGSSLCFSRFTAASASGCL